MKAIEIWVEVTTLLIPGLNDSEEEIRRMAEFVCSLGMETPWHVSRFHPQYQMTDKPMTPPSSIHQAVSLGQACGLKYVYSGNVPGDAGEKTHCSSCGELLIDRLGFYVNQMRLKEKNCPQCGNVLEGIL